jgi:hypothetical protein
MEIGKLYTLIDRDRRDWALWSAPVGYIIGYLQSNDVFMVLEKNINTSDYKILKSNSVIGWIWVQDNLHSSFKSLSDFF